MATSPSVFSFAHIAAFSGNHGSACAAGAGCSAISLQIARTFRLPAGGLWSWVTRRIVWRSAGNTRALNNDTIPLVSPNDVLCPLVTYLFLGFYAAFRPPLDVRRFEQARVLLTLVSFVVNVIMI